jgi:Rhodopirellula transposase DDE domain
MADADFMGRMGPELDLLLPLLDERARRLVLGAVARAAGAGGTATVAAATGASWQTVANGAAELASGDSAPPGRVRRPGAGRKRLADQDPGLVPALRALVEESTRGDPCSPLLWTTLSVRDIAAGLGRRGHRCSKNTVARLLAAEGFSLQGNSRTIEGRRHPDRDAQFRYIAGQAREFLAAGDPVISVDTKKKEPVGQYANGGRCWRPRGEPVRVRDHDFPDPKEGVAIPYGVYDVAANAGFVNVGIDHDAPAFAAGSIRRWWQETGAGRYPGARRLLITYDAGGSNDHRKRAWKAELAKLAAGTGLEITCCHFPPGTSPAPPSGTRSSTGCSATSPAPGGPGRWPATRSSSTPSPRPAPPPGSPSPPPSTPGTTPVVVEYWAAGLTWGYGTDMIGTRVCRAGLPAAGDRAVLARAAGALLGG